MRYLHNWGAVLLIFLLSASITSGQDANSTSGWIEKGSALFAQNEYEASAEAAKKALDLDPSHSGAKDLLLQSERHISIEILVRENNIEEDALDYLKYYGDRGRYFNQVRHELKSAYNLQAFALREANEVSQMEAIHSRYKGALYETSQDISNWIAFAARDSAAKAEGNKQWAEVIRYNSLVVANTKQRRDYEYALDQLANAKRKLGTRMLGCTESSAQVVYSLSSPTPIRSSGPPVFKRKQLYVPTSSPSGNKKESNLSTSDLILILDNNTIPPVFMVFNEKEKAFCSLTTAQSITNFPDHFSYRALTRDRKVITAGLVPYIKTFAEDPIRRLVNDNINKEPIADLQRESIVMEVFRTRNQFADQLEIHIHVSPGELAAFRDEIVKMIFKGYEDLENIAEGKAEHSEMASLGSGLDVTETNSVRDDDETESDIGSTENGPDSLTGNSGQAKSVVGTGPAGTQPTEIAEEPAEFDNPNLGKRFVPKFETVISEDEKLEIQTQAEEKLKELESCFTKLTNRKLTIAQKQRVRETAVEELFINDRASVSVSSLKSNEIVFYPIPQYLLRLENMIAGIYQEVEIEFSEVHKVTNFKRNPDNTWSATVTFTQKFQGYKDLDGRQLAYSDITQKNVTVRIKRVELFTGDSNPEVYWEVLLADIGVSQTEPFKD